LAEAGLKQGFGLARLRFLEVTGLARQGLPKLEVLEQPQSCTNIIKREKNVYTARCPETKIQPKSGFGAREVRQKNRVRE
jgi:hypothetical protein